MMDEKENLARKGFKVDSKEELEAAAVPAWKELFEKEPKKVKKYIDKHNEWEQKRNKTDLKHKYDQSGRSLEQITKEDLMKQQEKEDKEEFIKTTVKLLQEKGDLTREKFYIAYVNTICETQDRCHYPCEIAIVEYSIENGLGKCFQEFISPIKIPVGYRYQCNEKSKKTHNIPPDPHDFNLYIEDYGLIFESMKNFMTSEDPGDSFLPLYVMSNHMEAAEFIVKLISEKAESDKKIAIYKLPQLCHELMKVAPENGGDEEENMSDIHSAAQMSLLLDREIYKYWPGLGCKFHEELGNTAHCALTIVKGLAYGMVDIFSKPFNITKRLDKNFSPENGIDEKTSYSTTTREGANQAVIQDFINAWGTKVSVLAAPAGVTTIPTHFDPNSVELGVGAQQFPGMHPELKEQQPLPEEETEDTSICEGGRLFNLSDDDIESVKSMGSFRSAISTATTIRFGESQLAVTMSQQPGKPSLSDPKKETLHHLANKVPVPKRETLRPLVTSDPKRETPHSFASNDHKRGTTRPSATHDPKRGSPRPLAFSTPKRGTIPLLATSDPTLHPSTTRNPTRGTLHPPVTSDPKKGTLHPSTTSDPKGRALHNPATSDPKRLTLRRPLANRSGVVHDVKQEVDHPPTQENEKVNNGNEKVKSKGPEEVEVAKKLDAMCLEKEMDRSGIEIKMKSCENNQVERHGETKDVKQGPRLHLDPEKEFEIKKELIESEDGKSNMINRVQPESSRPCLYRRNDETKPRCDPTNVAKGRGKQNYATQIVRSRGRGLQNDSTNSVRQIGRGVLVQPDRSLSGTGRGNHIILKGKRD